MPDTTTNGKAPPATVTLIAEALKGIKRIDQGKFELGELEDLEDELGTSVAAYINSPAPPIRFMRGMLWLRLRRDYPDLRFDDLRAIDLDALEAAFGRDDEEEPESLDPTAAASTHAAMPTSGVSVTSPGSATSGT